MDSAPATVDITVTSVNDAPVANAQAVITAEDTPVVITLSGTDVDGDALTYTVVNGPAHGVLSGTAPGLTYTPAPTTTARQLHLQGQRRTADSAAATVSITVTPVNDPPVANAQAVTTAEDTALAITLTGSDADGNPLTYGVLSAPGHGTFSGTAPNLTYTPAANYNGPDSFTFKVNDGTVDSAAATVSITVTPVNDAPVANCAICHAPAGHAGCDHPDRLGCGRRPADLQRGDQPGPWHPERDHAEPDLHPCRRLQRP